MNDAYWQCTPHYDSPACFSCSIISFEGSGFFFHVPVFYNFDLSNFSISAISCLSDLVAEEMDWGVWRSEFWSVQWLHWVHLLTFYLVLDSCSISVYSFLDYILSNIFLSILFIAISVLDNCNIQISCGFLLIWFFSWLFFLIDFLLNAENHIWNNLFPSF